MQALAWVLVAAGVVVIGFAAVVTLLMLRSGADDVPTVSDIVATTDAGSVEFSWGDPGLADGASYQVSVDGGAVSVQRSTTFVYQGSAGERVCLIVSVNQDGRLGDPSAPKCVDIPG